jgi:hypothetical protein
MAIETHISKMEAEHIEACKQCKNLLSMRQGKHVEVKCSAIDRFDCPYLLKIFYPKIYTLPEEERRKLVARIRARKLNAEDVKYFS